MFVSTEPDSGEIRHASFTLLRWLNPFDYPYIPAGAVAKCAKRLLVGGTVVRVHGGLNGVELDKRRAQTCPALERYAGSPRARMRPPAARIAGPPSST